MSASVIPAAAARARSFRVAAIGPVPITAGGTPTTAVATTRAIGSSPCRRASASDMSSMAAAASLTGALVAAVTLPSPIV